MKALMAIILNKSKTWITSNLHPDIPQGFATPPTPPHVHQTYKWYPWGRSLIVIIQNIGPMLDTKWFLVSLDTSGT